MLRAVRVKHIHGKSTGCFVNGKPDFSCGNIAVCAERKNSKHEREYHDAQ
jgi:hypothetical protein